jgi:hypothetical protein
MNLARSLSDKEVVKIADPMNTKQIKFKTYNQIKDLPKLGEGYVILYRMTPNYGHYVYLLHRKDDNFEFGDSYGFTPDRELEWSKNKNHELGQDFPIISRLLRKIPEDKLEYQEKRLQDMRDPNDRTCGYFTGVRLLFRDLNLKQYQRLISDISKKSHQTPSQVVKSIGDLLL